MTLSIFSQLIFRAAAAERRSLGTNGLVVTGRGVGDRLTQIAA